MENQNKDKNQNKNEEKTGEKTAKITVTIEAETMLDRMLQQVNDRFSGGRVTRQDLATWIIRYFNQNAVTQCLEEIRADHFDQVAHLEALLKQAKQARRSGADSAAIASILSGGPPAVTKEPRRRAKKVEEVEKDSL